MGKRIPEFLERKRMVAQLTPAARGRVGYVAQELGISKARAIDAIIRAFPVGALGGLTADVLDGDAAATAAWKRGGKT